MYSTDRRIEWLWWKMGRDSQRRVDLHPTHTSSRRGWHCLQEWCVQYWCHTFWFLWNPIDPQLIETNDNASKKTASIAPKQKQANPLTHKQQLLNVGASDLSSSRTTSAASGRISPAQRSVQPRNDSTPKGKSKATHRPLPQPQLQVARSFPRKSVVKNPTLPQPIPIRTYTIGKEDDVIISSPKMVRKRKSPSFQRPDEPENVSISVHASTSIQLKRRILFLTYVCLSW